MFEYIWVCIFSVSMEFLQSLFLLETHYLDFHIGP